MKSLSWYKKLQTTSPIKAKALSGSMLFFIGDILCQSVEIHAFNLSDNYDLRRTMLQASFGLFINPYIYYQYNMIIPKLFPIQQKYSLIKSVLYTVTVSDSIYNFSYFGYMNMFQRRKSRKPFRDVKEKFFSAQLANLKIYPFITGINFCLIPINFRVLFDNLAGMFWNIYLTYVENRM
jgi:hypothetical protein